MVSLDVRPATDDSEALADAVLLLLQWLDNDQPWRRDALCREHQELDWHGPLTVAARVVCGRCPVRGECLGVAFADETILRLGGLWGGLNAKERRAYMRAGLGAREVLEGREPSTVGVGVWTCRRCGETFERAPRRGKPAPAFCGSRCAGLYGYEERLRRSS